MLSISTSFTRTSSLSWVIYLCRFSIIISRVLRTWSFELMSDYALCSSACFFSSLSCIFWTSSCMHFILKSFLSSSLWSYLLPPRSSSRSLVNWTNCSFFSSFIRSLSRLSSVHSDRLSWFFRLCVSSSLRSCLMSSRSFLSSAFAYSD